MPKTFKADVPPESGWYFATNNPADPTNQSLGWYDAERRVFTVLDVETPAALEQPPWVTAWRFTADGWEDPTGDGWSGPELWHGPIVSPWDAAGVSE